MSDGSGVVVKDPYWVDERHRADSIYVVSKEEMVLIALKSIEFV